MVNDETAAKFWRRVNKKTPNECWEWQGCTTGRNGHKYGRVTVNNRSALAHRLAYELHHGRTLAPTEVVSHRCDNPVCCNPHHLCATTQAGNQLDKAWKGRSIGNVDNDKRRSKKVLTEEEKRRVIGLRVSQRISQVKLAELFGVSYKQIAQVLHEAH